MKGLETSIERVNSELSKILDELLNLGDDIQLHEPIIDENELKLVTDCIKSGWVSSVGKFVTEFEERIQEITKAKHAVAVVNGTAALHTALLLVNVRPGDEVLLPSVSFVATANAVSHCNAVPNFVDIDKISLGIDPFKLRSYLNNLCSRKNGQLFNNITGRKVSAVIAVHTFGHSPDLDELKKVADEFQLPIIEDAAEALGSFYKGKHAGTIGNCGIISFNGNKILTTGGGGVLLLNDTEMAKKAKHISSTAKLPHRWEYFHDEIGWNYRMPNLNASLGVAQLRRLNFQITEKRKIAQKYMDAFKDSQFFDFFSENTFSKSNYWLNAIMLKEPNFQIRDEVLSMLHSKRIFARPLWHGLHRLPMYKDCPRDNLKCSEILEMSTINLPSSAQLIQRKIFK